jgi:hypothetical protein
VLRAVQDAKIDNAPGLYFFFSGRPALENLRYLGQAKQLRSRLISHFRDDTALDETVDDLDGLQLWQTALLRMDKSMPHSAKSKIVEYAFNHVRRRSYIRTSDVVVAVALSDASHLDFIERLLIRSAFWCGAPTTNCQDKIDIESVRTAVEGIEEAEAVAKALCRVGFDTVSAQAWVRVMQAILARIRSLCGG